MDLWLFLVDSGRSLRSIQVADIHCRPTTELCTPTRVVFASEKKRGGLRILDARLAHDVAIAPVSPPHVHSDYSSSIAARGHPPSPNIAIAMAMCCGTSREDLWIGWSSGHISILNTRRPPVVGDGAVDDIPRFSDWDDLLYAHRGAVHMLAATHGCRFVVSASYDTNVIVWDAENRRQLRSLTGIAKQHLSLAGGAQPSLAGVCRAVCQVPIGSMKHAGPAVGLMLVLDGGAQILFHGVEGYLGSTSDGEDPVVVSVASLPNSFSSPICAAAELFHEGLGLGILCRGDEGARLHFTPLTSGSQDGFDIVSLNDVAEELDRAASTLALGPAKQMGKVIDIVALGGVPSCEATPSLRPDGDARGGSSVHVYNFSFLVTTACRYVALVQCTITSALSGAAIMSTSVAALQTVPSPITVLRPSNPSRRYPSEDSSLRLFYGISADGSVSALLTFGLLQPRFAPPASGGKQWTHGDFLREQARLKNAVELVQQAKNSTILADAMLHEDLQKQTELEEDNRRLRARIQELERSLHSEQDRSLRLHEHVQSVESSSEASRAKLNSAASEIKRLSELLKIAAADQDRTIRELSASSEREILHAHKVQACLAQLDAQVEVTTSTEQQLRDANARVAQLSAQSEVLVAKVFELERLVAREETELRNEQQEQDANAVARLRIDRRLLEDQQEIIQELKSRYHAASQDATAHKRLSERLQDEIVHWKRSFESAKSLLKRGDDDNAVPRSSFSPIYKGQDDGQSATFASASRAALSGHATPDTMFRLDGLASRLTGESPGTNRSPVVTTNSTGKQLQPNSSSTTLQSGTNIGDEYLKSLAPPIRSVSSATNARSGEQTLLTPTDLSRIGGGEWHDGGSTKQQGGAMRSVTVSLSS
jgi:hypothetical protein